MEYGVYKEIYLRDEHFFDVYARELIETFASKDASFSVLDVGCGFGNFLRSFRREWISSGRNPDLLTLDGITIANHEVEFIRDRELKRATSETPVINVFSGDQAKASQILTREKYDLLLNFHTLSYLTQDEQMRTLRHELLPLLCRTGNLVVSWIDPWVKENSGISNQGPGYLQFFYNPRLWSLLGRVGHLKKTFKDPIHGYRISYWKLRKKESFLGALFGWLTGQWIRFI